MVGLGHVLDIFGQTHPRMHALFVDRERGWRKTRFCEGAHGNDNTVFATFRGEVDGGAAHRAEGEPGPSSFVSNPDIRRTFSADLDGFSGKPCLSPKDTSGTALTGMAMTDRHPDRFSRDFGRELAATARRDSIGHGAPEVGLV